METESRIFLVCIIETSYIYKYIYIVLYTNLLLPLFQKHQPPASIEGEDVRITDTAFDFYSITPWLDNIVDSIDIRDTESLLLAKRYLNGLYSLLSDYEPGA